MRGMPTEAPWLAGCTHPVPSMKLRSFVFASALVFIGCSSSSQEVRETTPSPAKVPEPSVDPARKIAELARMENPSRSEIASRIVSREEHGTIVEVSWNERAPNTIEALDDASMSVVRRFMVRGEHIEAIAPRAWEVDEPLLVCTDGRSDVLSGETDDPSCVHVAPLARIEPTGESIMVPAPGPIPTALAYRVRLPGDPKLYWTIPATSCSVSIELDDGTLGRAVGSCSAITDGEPQLF